MVRLGEQLFYAFWLLLGVEVFSLPYIHKRYIPKRYIPKRVNPAWLRALPFHRSLRLKTPLMEGGDVGILQNLLLRQSSSSSTLKATGRYDRATHESLKAFQLHHKLSQQDGILDPETGRKVIEELISDRHSTADIPNDCKFFIRVLVHKDRSKELNATLYSCGPDREVLHTFLVRARGGTRKGVRLNQLTTNGDTPTGLSSVDLNTEFQPQSRWKRSFGEYPVLRLIKGLKGNVAIGREDITGNDNTTETFLNDYRYGILVHSFLRDGWDPSMPMPDSLGCMKVHPVDQKKMVDILLYKLGVKLRNNTMGRLPYPHEPQGLISVEEVD